MEQWSIVKKLIYTIISVIIIGYLLNNFIYGNRRLYIILSALMGIGGGIMLTFRNISIIKKSNNQEHIVASKISLFKTIIGVIGVSIFTLVGFIFYI
jgi:F0F1-type ATP synthase assembly protein I